MEKRNKKEHDFSVTAFRVVQEATEQTVVEEKAAREFDAKALGREGGLKGGRTRAARLSPERRAEIAKKAAQARWGKGSTMNKNNIVNLEKEFHYYLAHQEELVKEYNGKFIVIKDHKVLGAFDSALEAVENTTEQHELGTFLVQKCESGSTSYTQTFHSRVSIQV